jgi:hypothetical protein
VRFCEPLPFEVETPGPETLTAGVGTPEELHVIFVDPGYVVVVGEAPMLAAGGVVENPAAGTFAPFGVLIM